MKLVRFIAFFAFSMSVFVSCKNDDRKAPEDTDAVFSSEPALRVITQQIEKTPGDASLYFERGHMLARLQRDSLALTDFKRAVAIDSTNSMYYSAIGDLLFENKDITGSVEWIRKAIALNPDDKKARLKIAKLLLYIKNYPESFKEVNKVLMKDVHNAEAYFLKGMLYKDLGDTAKAISNFLTSVQESPDYRESVIQLGLMYSAKNDPVALQYLENAFKMDTTDVFPLYAKGMYHQGRKDYPAAKEEYTRAINHDSHYVDAFFNMGYMLLQEDSAQKSWRQYNIVTKIDPTNPAGFFNRGLCSEIMDSFANAAEDYRRAISLDPDYKSPKEALARLTKKGKASSK